MKIEVSLGEIVDKYTILLIKEMKISDEKKLYNVKRERQYIESVLEENLKSLKPYTDALFLVNEKLWNIEDQIRIKESINQFDDEFVSLARSVYHTNDERARIKRELNEKTSSNFIEEKQYMEYRL
jgi:hypothetical protein